MTAASLKILVTCPICKTEIIMSSKVTIFGIDVSRFVKYSGDGIIKKVASK